MSSPGRIAVLLVVLAVIAASTLVPGVTGAPTPPVVDGDYADAEGGLVIGGVPYTVDATPAEQVVTVGETVSITATVTNPGDRTGLQGVTLKLDRNGDGVYGPDELIEGVGVVLDAGTNRTVSFDVSVPLTMQPGEYAYAVSTTNHSSEGVLVVEPLPTPATYDTVGLSGPASAVQGESVLVSATVANVGDLNGTDNASLRFDYDGDGLLSENETVSSVAVDYSSGANGTHDFELAVPEDLDPGTYTYGVFTDAANRTAALTVERAPAPFEVVSVMGTTRTTRSSMLGVTAIIENTGDEDRTGTVEFRVDQNGDGILAESETVRTREVELGAGASQLYSFGAPVPNDFRPGTYTYGVFTEVDSMTKSYEVYMSGGSDESSPSGEVTRGDVAQALYGQDFDELGGTEAAQAQDVYNRLPAGGDLEEIQTLEEISQDVYQKPFVVHSPHLDDKDQYTLTKAQALDVRNTYDEQFGPLPTDPEYTLDELAYGIFWTSFDALGPDSAVQVQAVYNRQPFADGYTDTNVETLRQMLNDMEEGDGIYVHGWQSVGSEPGLTVEDILRIQQAYDAQFGE